jgi:hypothetical protein
MTHPSAVVLNRAVVAAHLTELQESGAVEMVVKDNRLMYSMGQP